MGGASFGVPLGSFEKGCGLGLLGWVALDFNHLLECLRVKEQCCRWLWELLCLSLT